MSGEKVIIFKQRLDDLASELGIEDKRKKLKEMEAELSKPDFWADQEKAVRITLKIESIRREIQAVEELRNLINELSYRGEGKDFEERIREIQEKIEKLEITTFLSSPYDNLNAILSIHAGQGGVEAMDWAQMLQRMYMKFAERRGWIVDVVDMVRGEEAGIKSVTMFIKGSLAYGYLKGEAGVHRLVRQSPFNANRLRQTSFAQVIVLPEIEEIGEIEIKPDDLEWDFFRSSSQGGQNVQKVSTAVRLKHKPTGIVVCAQKERYQEQNRKIALSLLRAKLWELRQIEKEKEKKELVGEYKPASWGAQIRSYVLHPYRMVKDLRTGVQTSDAEKVLDGNIDEFVEKEIRLARS